MNLCFIEIFVNKSAGISDVNIYSTKQSYYLLLFYNYDFSIENGKLYYEIQDSLIIYIY